MLEAVAEGAEGFQRRVAIKRLLPGHEQDAALVGMFVDEARIASRLHHGNIVSVFDYGIVDGQPFQVLELVDGLDAGQLCARGRQRDTPLPLPLALHIGTTIGHALHHAHTATDLEGQPLGIVHRDVSPANILVSWDGDVLLTDFGIAFAKQRSERTQTGMAKGTVMYWAPEQATAGRVDPRTDVFALGATVHRLIVGRSPLAGENALADLLVGRPLPLDPSLPPDVAEVIARAVQRDKAERYADAGALAAALGACMSSRLAEDPRSALRRWLEALRDPEPAPEPAPRGRLDALFDVQWVVAGTDDGVRTFVVERTSPAPAPAPVPVATDEVAAGGTELSPASPTTDEPEPRRVIAVVIAVLGVLLVGGVGAWAWASGMVDGGGGRSESSIAAASEESPSTPLPTEAAAVGSTTDSTAASDVTSDTDALGTDETADTGEDDDTGSSTGATASIEPLPKRSSGSKPSAKSPPRPPKRAEPSSPSVAGGPAFVLIGGAGALRAEIMVGGRSHGFAPRLVKLPMGRHRVVLRDAQGKVVSQRQVDLRSSHTRSSPLRWNVAP